MIRAFSVSALIFGLCMKAVSPTRDRTQRQDDASHVRILFESIERIEAEITSTLREIDAYYARALEQAAHCFRAVRTFRGHIDDVYKANTIWRSCLERIEQNVAETVMPSPGKGKRATAIRSRNDKGTREALKKDETEELWLEEDASVLVEKSILPDTPTFQSLSLSPPATPSVGAVERSPTDDDGSDNASLRDAHFSKHPLTQPKTKSLCSSKQTIEQSEWDQALEIPVEPSTPEKHAQETAQPPTALEFSVFPHAFQNGEGSIQLEAVYVQIRACHPRAITTKHLLQILGEVYHDENIALLCELLESRGYVRAFHQEDGSVCWQSSIDSTRSYL